MQRASLPAARALLPLLPGQRRDEVRQALAAVLRVLGRVGLIRLAGAAQQHFNSRVLGREDAETKEEAGASARAHQKLLVVEPSGNERRRDALLQRRLPPEPPAAASAAATGALARASPREAPAGPRAAWPAPLPLLAPLIAAREPFHASRHRPVRAALVVRERPLQRTVEAGKPPVLDHPGNLRAARRDECEARAERAKLGGAEGPGGRIRSSLASLNTDSSASQSGRAFFIPEVIRIE